MSSGADQRRNLGTRAFALALAVFALVFWSPLAFALQAHDYKMAGDAVRMRVVMKRS